MKASLIITALIFAVALWIGLRQGGELSAARDAHRQEVDRAVALGLDPGTVADGAAVTKSAQRDLDARTAKALSTADELIDFQKKMKELQESGKSADADLQKLAIGMLRRFTELDPTQLKAVIADVTHRAGLDDEAREQIIWLAISTMAKDRPEAALAAYLESAQWAKNPNTSIVTPALVGWAGKDPVAAMAWLREQTAARPELVPESAESAVLTGAAKFDPKQAVRLISDLSLDLEAQSRALVAGLDRTPGARNSLLSALNDADVADDLKKQTHASLSRQIVEEGFSASQAWLTSSGLSGEDAAGLAENLQPGRTGPDTGKWIEWMSDALPAEVRDRKVDAFLREWTSRDFNAAAAWLNDTPEGPMKQTAITSFAKTVAPYEPESALQWANTLPPGQERDALLQEIRQKAENSQP